MILKSDEAKKGALDALRILIGGKERQQQLDKKDVGTPILQAEDQEKLIMPKKAEQAKSSRQEAEEAGEKDGDMNELQNPMGDDGEDDGEGNPTKIDSEKMDDEAQIKQDLDDYFNTIKNKQQAIKRKEAEDKRAIEKARAIKNRVVTFDNFKKDLYRAVNTQINQRKMKVGTFQRPNPRYAGTNLLPQGTKRVKITDIPVIQVYLDNSGSVGQYQKDILAALKTLDDFERQKLIKKEVWYFADNISKTKGGCHGCTEAFPVILKNIKETKPDNVLILTDSDFDSQTKWSECVRVLLSGCMWWVWPNKGNRCVNAMDYIATKNPESTIQYSLNI